MYITYHLHICFSEEVHMSAIYVRTATYVDMIDVDRLHSVVYYDEGYLPCAEPPEMTRLVPYADAAYTQVFIACVKDQLGGEQIIGTLSLTKQSAHGFPFFADDFSELSALLSEDGTCCALLWRFAIERNYRSRGVPMLLFEAAYAASRGRGITCVVCVVNPDKHAHFYCNKLSFKRISKEQHSCEHTETHVTASGLTNVPAILLAAPLQGIGDRLAALRKGIIRINLK